MKLPVTVMLLSASLLLAACGLDQKTSKGQLKEETGVYDPIGNNIDPMIGKFSGHTLTIPSRSCEVNITKEFYQANRGSYLSIVVQETTGKNRFGLSAPGEDLMKQINEGKSCLSFNYDQEPTGFGAARRTLHHGKLYTVFGRLVGVSGYSAYVDLVVLRDVQADINCIGLQKIR